MLEQNPHPSASDCRLLGFAFIFGGVLKKAFKIWSGARALPEMYNFMDIL